VDQLYNVAESLVKKVYSRDPFDLLGYIGARVKYNYEYQPDGLQGYATIIKRIKFAVINGHLNSNYRRIVAGHEAAHLINHQAEILSSPSLALQDFNMFNGSGRLEYQANSFLADFLVSDKEIMELIKSEEHDYFTVANELRLPPALLSFKLYSMIARGHNVRNPVDLNSAFLKNDNWK
jgi:Zn-dependent peptidase ImmA (M78 family)